MWGHSGREATSLPGGFTHSSTSTTPTFNLPLLLKHRAEGRVGTRSRQWRDVSRGMRKVPSHTIPQSSYRVTTPLKIILQRADLFKTVCFSNPILQQATEGRTGFPSTWFCATPQKISPKWTREVFALCNLCWQVSWGEVGYLCFSEVHDKIKGALGPGHRRSTASSLPTHLNTHFSPEWLSIPADTSPPWPLFSGHWALHPTATLPLPSIPPSTAWRHAHLSTWHLYIPWITV